jgi:hypothetical protein
VGDLAVDATEVDDGVGVDVLLELRRIFLLVLFFLLLLRLRHLLLLIFLLTLYLRFHLLRLNRRDDEDFLCRLIRLWIAIEYVASVLTVGLAESPPERL